MKGNEESLGNTDSHLPSIPSSTASLKWHLEIDFVYLIPPISYGPLLMTTQTGARH